MQKPRPDSAFSVAARAYLALFSSGLAALVLQVAWTRMAVVFFGTTTVAVTLVFSVFMGGLAVGNAISGRILHRVRRPFLAYAVIEVATLALALTIAISVKMFGLSPSVPTPLVLAGGLVPTILMGMTLPLVVSGLCAAGVGKTAVPLSYGINTLGGAAGALTGAFFWIPAMGTASSCLAACAALAIACAVALTLRGVTTESLPMAERTAERGRAWALLALAAFAGGGSLSLEIVWTRLLSLILGPSVYALGIVLFVYLSGIAMGSVLAAPVMRRVSARDSVWACLLLLALSTAWSAASFAFLPYLFLALVETFMPDPSRLRWIEFVLSGLAIAPGAVLHGAFLPFLIGAYPVKAGAGRATAYVLSANTLGAILGAAATGLWLIPKFGFLPILLAVLMLDLAFGLVLFSLARHVGTAPLRASFVATAVLFGVVFFVSADKMWDRSVLVSGVYKYAVGDALRGSKARIELGTIVYYREGISSTVAVIDTSDDRVLSIDGKADASAQGDKSTQVLLGALPQSLARRHEKVLVVGFASGVTSGVASLFDGARVTSVEIEPAVLEASRYFEHVNFGPLLPPQHTTVVADARHFLVTTKEVFDVITSEPSNPWMSGVAPLFTREFFETARRRLARGGVMCQWLPIYGMSRDLVASVMATFASVFPEVLVFESAEGYDLLLIGSQEALALSAEGMQSRWRNDDLRRELASIGIRDGVDMIGRFLMGTSGVRSFSAGAVYNTDDNGYVEFRAPLSLHLKTAEANDRALSESSEGVLPHLSPEMLDQSLRAALAARFELRGKRELAGGLVP